MNYSEIKYPLRLCVEMMHFSVWSCEKTQNMKASEIKSALSVFFTKEQIDEAQKILTGDR
jgi:hypothetical protein